MMRPDLEARGIRILLVCTDRPGLIRTGRALHGNRAVIVSDPDLAVTDLFGLRNGGVNVRPPGTPALPIPTTLLIDADGVVRWMDQSRHYSERANPERVAAAVARYT